MVPVAQRAGLREPLSRRRAGRATAAARVSRDGDPARRGRASRCGRASTRCSTADGIPYPKIATLHGARRAGHDGAADLHPLPEPHQACQFCAIGHRWRPADPGAQDAASSSPRSPRPPSARRREQMVMTTGTPPDATAAPQSVRRAPSRSRRRSSCRSRGNASRPTTSPGSTHAGRRDRRARHAPRGGEPGVRQRIMPGKARSRSSATWRRSRRRCRSSAAARSAPTSSPGSATRASLLDIAGRCRARRLSVRGAVRAHRRHAAGSHPAPTPAFMHEILRPLAEHAAPTRHDLRRHQGRLRQMRRLLGAFDLRKEGADMIFEPFKPFLASAYQIKFDP